MIEQPVSYTSILGGGSEPLSSIPILDNNWLCCANQVVMLDDSDKDIPALEDLSQEDIEVNNQHIVFNSPYGLNVSLIDAMILLEDIYANHGASPINSNESTTIVPDEIVSRSMVEIHQTHTDGPFTGRSRIVSIGFRGTAEYIDDDFDSDNSSMPEMVTLSSSELEYFYSDGERDTLSRFFDDDDGADGIGLLE